jgi:hypothetical protein
MIFIPSNCLEFQFVPLIVGEYTTFVPSFTDNNSKRHSARFVRKHTNCQENIDCTFIDRCGPYILIDKKGWNTARIFLYQNKEAAKSVFYDCLSTCENGKCCG